MNNQIIPFDFENKTVRTVIADGIPWFVAKDVCNALELSKYRTILETTRKDTKGRDYVNFPEDEKGVHDLGHPSGGIQKTLCVNEPGLYRLVHRAHTPGAERFKRKVYHEVLPQIRKTGGYRVNAGELTALRESLLLAKSERDTYKRLWLEDRGTIRRYENRSFLTTQDKREIITLHFRKYPVTAIQRITKKGRGRIKNFIDEFLSNEETQETLFAAWEKDEEPSESFGGPLEAPRGKEGGAV